MNEYPQSIDRAALNRLAERLEKRGIPKWEQAPFIEQIVPQLVAALLSYINGEKQPNPSIAQPIPLPIAAQRGRRT
jgi:hypothetical protein